MLEWFGKNIGTIIVLALLAAGVITVIRGMIKQKRSGSASCGCGCSGCSMSESCGHGKH